MLKILHKSFLYFDCRALFVRRFADVLRIELLFSLLYMCPEFSNVSNKSQEEFLGNENYSDLTSLTQSIKWEMCFLQSHYIAKWKVTDPMSCQVLVNQSMIRGVFCGTTRTYTCAHTHTHTHMSLSVSTLLMFWLCRRPGGYLGSMGRCTEYAYNAEMSRCHGGRNLRATCQHVRTINPCISIWRDCCGPPGSISTRRISIQPLSLVWFPKEHVWWWTLTCHVIVNPTHCITISSHTA